jgi:undecaprenyl diphosphate synthase
MDGNGRWAQKRRIPRSVGHAKGAAMARELVKFCAANSKMKYLTLFAFSTENWLRPRDEVSTLMSLFLEYLDKEIKNLVQAGVQLRIIGNVNRFTEELQKKITQSVNATLESKGLVLTVAANYGGRWDIVQAFKRWQLAHPQADAKNFSEDQLDKFLSTSSMPPLDLLIRTGGEQRISNFMLWQAAYAELYFTDILWPDFDSGQFELALNWYGKRERRFGQINLCDE